MVSRDSAFPYISEEECQSLANETFNLMVKKFCNGVFYCSENHGREPFTSTHYGEEYDSTLEFIPDKRIYPLENILATLVSAKLTNRDVAHRFMTLTLMNFLNKEKKLIEHPKYEWYENFYVRQIEEDSRSEKHGHYTNPIFQGDFHLEDNVWAIIAASAAGLDEIAKELCCSVKKAFFDSKSNRFMSQISTGEFDSIGMGKRILYDNALATLALYSMGDVDAKPHAEMIIMPIDKGGFLNKDNRFRWTCQDKDATNALVALMLYFLDNENKELIEQVKEREKEQMRLRVLESPWDTKWNFEDFFRICSLNMMGERDFSRYLLSKIRDSRGASIDSPEVYAMQAIAYSGKPLFPEPTKYALQKITTQLY